MRVTGLSARVLFTLMVSAWISGCINLPAALERELECPPAGTPDNFGSVQTCRDQDSR